MNALGKHLIIEFHECSAEILNSTELCEKYLIDAVNISGATVIQPFFHKFNPHGVSGIIVIAESHFSIHTWPEYGYCALDVFTCGDEIDGEAAVKFLKGAFQAKYSSVMEVKRGLLDLPDSQIKHKPELVET